MRHPVCHRKGQSQKVEAWEYKTSLEVGRITSLEALATVEGVDNGRVASEGDSRGDGHEGKCDDRDELQEQ